MARPRTLFALTRDHRRHAGMLLFIPLAVVTAGPVGGEDAGGNGLTLGDAVLRAQPDEIVSRLERDKVALLPASNGRDGAVEGFVIFDRPRAEVFHALAETDRQREWRSELESVETIESAPEGSLDEHSIKVMFVRLRYRLRYSIDARHTRIRWELEPGYDNSIEHMAGSWDLWDLERVRTLGLFRTSVRVGAGLPPFLESGMTRRKVPKTLQQARRWVNAGAESP